MMSSTKETLFKTIAPCSPSSNKITIVGAGAVGMACALSLLTQNVSNDLALVDAVEDRLKGEMLDLQHGSQFVNDAKINASTDYSITKNSRICIVTAGVRQVEGQTRLDLVDANTKIMKIIIPQLVTHSPNTILLIVTNPVDIVTYVVWKISGLPKHRVIGSGTNLDSSRFRFLLSQRLGIAPEDCNGWIIGEHGDSSVAVWSGVNIAGVYLKNVNPKFGATDDHENWNELHKEVINSGYEVVKLKGFTCWAIGLSIGSLCDAILKNMENVHAVSVYVKDIHGITNDVFLSLPAILGENGVRDVVIQDLSIEELACLHDSAKLMDELQCKLKL